MIKVEFKEYPSGSWVDWTNYLVDKPSIAQNLESEDEAKAGLIGYDSSKLSFYSIPGNPVHTAFNGDLTAVQRYMLRISFYKSDGNPEERFEAMVDFSEIERPTLSNQISFEIKDKLSALSILENVPQRTLKDGWLRLQTEIGDATEKIAYFEWLEGNVSDPYGKILVIRTWRGYGSPQSTYFMEHTSPIFEVGEVLHDPDPDKSEGYLIVDSGLIKVSDDFMVGSDGTNSGPNGTYDTTWVKLLPADQMSGYGNFNTPGTTLNYYDKKYFGVDDIIILGPASYDSNKDVAEAFDGVQLIHSIVKQQWPDIQLIKRGVNKFNVPLEYQEQLIGTNPFNGNHLDALKELSNTMECYINIDNTGNLVIQKKDALGTGGVRRTIGSTRIVDRVGRDFWKKLSDGAEVTVKSWLKNEDGEYLTGESTVTKSIGGSNMAPKNPVRKTILSTNANNTTKEDLDNEAAQAANTELNFYGKRHNVIEYILALDDNTKQWQINDNLIEDGKEYFFASFDIGSDQNELSVTLVSAEGYDYDHRQVVFADTKESSSSTRVISSSGTSGGGSQAYTFLPPLQLIGSTVELNHTDNLRKVGGSLDTIQAIKTTSNVEFAGIGIGGVHDSTYKARFYGDAKVDGDLTVDGDVYIAGNVNTVNQVVLDVVDKTIRLNVGGNNTTAVAGGIIMEGTGASDLASIKWDGANWLFDKDVKLNQNLGIGTAPVHKLHLYKENSFNGVIAGFYNQAGDTDAAGGSDADNGFIHIGGAQQNNHYGVLIGFENEKNSPSTQNSAFIVKTNSSIGMSHVERFRISADGEVGIGTASPNSILTLGGIPTITTATNDGADNKRLGLSGGGSLSVTRGAYVLAHGNEYASDGGSLWLVSGNVAGNYIDMKIGGASKMRLTSSGKVGVGTIDPDRVFHIQEGDASATGHSYAPLVVERNDHCAISILCPADRTGYLMFGDPTDNYAGGIEYNHSINRMTFQVNNIDAVNINNAGSLGIGIVPTSEILEINGNTKQYGAIYSDNFNGVDPYTGYYIGKQGSIFSKITANELHVKSFIADLEQALAGSQVISKSVAKLATDVQLPPAYTVPFNITVESFEGFPNVAVFAQSDIVRLRSGFNRTNNSLTITDSWAVISNATPTYIDNGRKQIWEIELVSGAVDVTVKSGAIINDYGQSGNGIIESIAVNPLGSGPISQIATWATAPYTDMTIQDRRGELNGITSANWGALSGYGTYTKRIFMESGNTTGIAIKVDKDTAYLGMKQNGNTVFDFNTSTAKAHIAGWELTHEKISTRDGFYKHVEMNSSGYIYAGMGYAPYDEDKGITFGIIPTGEPNAGHVGLQARDNYSNKTYFTLTDQLRKIATWEFDNEKLWSGDVSFESTGFMKGLRIKSGSYTAVQVGDFDNAPETFYTSSIPVSGTTWTTEHNSHSQSFNISNSNNEITLTADDPSSFTQVSARYSKALPINDVKGKTVKVIIDVKQVEGSDGDGQVSLTGMIKSDNMDLDLKNITTSVQDIAGASYTRFTFYAAIPPNASTAELWFYYHYHNSANDPATVSVKFISCDIYTKSKIELNKSGLKQFSSPITSIDLTDGKAEFNVGSLKASSAFQIGNFRFVPQIKLGDNGTTYQKLVIQFFDGSSWSNIGGFLENGVYSTN